MSEQETLDPQDWNNFRNLAHHMVDDMLHYLQTVSDRPAWTKPALNSISMLEQRLPEKPSQPAAVYNEFKENILPYNLNNIHPRFWAWVQGTGTPFGMLADMLASGMNANVAIGDHMPMYVEKQVIEWSRQMMGFTKGTTGILTSGASLANITAMLVARNQFHESIKTKGLLAAGTQLVMYGSAETHSCVIKAAEVIGIGSANFRRIAVDENYRINTTELSAAISRDRANGLQPFCIIGNAGTVNTGAIDPLQELANIAKRENLWFHVDGAFGAIPKLLPEFGEKLGGIELADSLSFDFHKWFYMNYEVACVLIRDGNLHRQTFSVPVSYLLQHDEGLSAGPEPFANFGMELSRGFKALKVWMLLKEHGLEKYRQMIRKNISQASYLEEKIEANPDLELLSRTELNIVCFRFNPGGLDQVALNELNRRILMKLHTEGIAAPSYTVLKGNYAIRVAITNHRSQFSDFDVLVEETLRIGHALGREEPAAVNHI